MMRSPRPMPTYASSPSSSSCIADSDSHEPFETLALPAHRRAPWRRPPRPGEHTRGDPPRAIARLWRPRIRREAVARWRRDPHARRDARAHDEWPGTGGGPLVGRAAAVGRRRLAFRGLSRRANAELRGGAEGAPRAGDDGAHRDQAHARLRRHDRAPRRDGDAAALGGRRRESDLLVVFV